MTNTKTRIKTEVNKIKIYHKAKNQLVIKIKFKAK